jgi:hypothetical protein
MNHSLILIALVSACGGGNAAAPASVAPPTVAASAPAPAPAPAPSSIPDTAAGKTLGVWLDVFNSADEARITTFVADYKFPLPAGPQVQFRSQTGGFELVRIEKTEALAIRFVVKEKSSSTTAVGWLRVKEGGREVESFDILAIPQGMTSDQMNIEVDAATRARVIDAAIAKLDELYVFPDVAKQMAQALRDRQKSGAYEAIRQAPAFAKRLTQDLREVSKDLHLAVQFTLKPQPETVPPPSDESKAQQRTQLEKVNCGFQKAERLDGSNIGYIKLDMFGDAEICGPKATAAFEALGDAEILIIDLRQNGGGQPEMVAFVSSYLFAKRTHLNDIYDRKQNKTTQHWTKADVPGKKFPKQPVLVLTSKNTFSGAEEFAYNLKNLKRATIVGETTGGGAHPTSAVRLDTHFKMGVPFARAINPITKTNWEGKGVEPDIKVPAADALDTAKKLAAERLAKKKSS